MPGGGWRVLNERTATTQPGQAFAATRQRLEQLPVAAAAADENASWENRWCQLRDTVQSTALTVLGRTHRQHQDWFDGNDAAISNLLAEKNCLHKAYLDRPTDDNRAAFYPPMAIPYLLKRHKFYSDGPNTSEASSTVPPNLRRRHRPSAQVETNVYLDFPPSLQETLRAVQQLFSGKAPGSDAIPAEVYKHGGPQLMDHLTALFQEM
ncbi:hypothetical protein SprV_0100104300 [Sparganum proliferum]